MMSAPSIILSRPQTGENIGAAARAMANFGLSDLRLVAPKCPWPNEKATAMAVGARNGTERAGLENDEISLCDAVITIPTSEFTSINLGQAVLITAYEWFRATDTTQ